MTISTFARQLFVAGSPQLAALSVGAAVSFPSVLLQQFSSNDSSIHLELDTASWIGSIHGLAGIPSIMMPAIMQWKGRKFAFISACLVSIIGWVLAYAANNSLTVLISESFHGLGNNSLLAVSLLSISEMVSPKFRSVSMVSFHVVQSFGMALVAILGRYLHWKTVSWIMCLPVLVALLMGLMWPESPSWLAYKGRFEKCEQAFVWLRGTDEFSKKELHELISSQKENMKLDKNHTSGFKLQTLLRRDFYLPSLHMFVLLCLTYWSGVLVILIYSVEMIQRATRNENAAFFGSILMNSIMFVCVGTSAVLIKRFSNKSVLLLSIICTVVSLLCFSVVNYIQSIEMISKDSLVCLYLLAAYMIASSLGVLPIVFTVAAELMPVKHRGLGGALYVIFTCILHATSLKAAPYLFLYINLWGTLLLYAVNTTICGLIIWKFIPETKGRTLQEIEDYYVHGNFDTKRANNLNQEHIDID
ncbi:Sugar transporter [Operophtera brumata]|uniref:Sugar transporter n=1 Tax=Operophtera brumata TaxID=104452 RepID=A0A0L7LC11_OPEBR|nr:Sugar transporter [Operophtera brumata]